jgi:hypothetical protein
MKYRIEHTGELRADIFEPILNPDRSRAEVCIPVSTGLNTLSDARRWNRPILSVDAHLNE